MRGRQGGSFGGRSVQAAGGAPSELARGEVSGKELKGKEECRIAADPRDQTFLHSPGSLVTRLSSLMHIILEKP